MAIKTNNDLSCGQVLTCKNGEMYVVITDDNGHHDVINLGTGKSNGIEVGTNRIAVCGGNSGGGRNVVKIQEFSGVPTRNRLSEALKFMTKRAFTEELSTVWTSADPEKEARKAAIEAKRAELDAMEREFTAKYC